MLFTIHLQMLQWACRFGVWNFFTFAEEMKHVIAFIELADKRSTIEKHLTFFTIPFCSIISFHYILAFSITAAYSMYLNWNVSINDSKILYLMISLSIRYFASLFYEYNWNVCLFNVKLNDRINELYFTYSAFDAVDRCVVCNLHMIGLLNIFLIFIDAREREREKVKHEKMEIQAKIRIFYLFISIRQTPLGVGMRLPKRLIKVTEPSFFTWNVSHFNWMKFFLPFGFRNSSFNLDSIKKYPRNVNHCENFGRVHLIWK